jgi:CHAT domain-containing protein
MSFLPLHAAGRHDTRFDATPQTVIDRVISSYTPTIRALTYTRRLRTVSTNGESGHPGQLVVVAMPHTPAADALPGAADEVALLRRLFPQAAILEGPRATYDNVRDALLCHTWAHFACHAGSDLNNPSASYLLLHDHLSRPLIVVDVSRLRLDAELAFLSACSTARTGGTLLDEAIHLASAFQLAGYRHVIATLWPIGDRPAVRVATSVYTALAVNQSADATAGALHHAVRQLRAILPDRPSVWAAHIHNGG